MKRHGVKDVTFEPVLGSLTTPDAKLIMCGNPTQLSGSFLIVIIKTEVYIKHLKYQVKTQKEFQKNTYK